MLLTGFNCTAGLLLTGFNYKVGLLLTGFNYKVGLLLTGFCCSSYLALRDALGPSSYPLLLLSAGSLKKNILFKSLREGLHDRLQEGGKEGGGREEGGRGCGGNPPHSTNYRTIPHLTEVQLYNHVFVRHVGKEDSTFHLLLIQSEGYSEVVPVTSEGDTRGRRLQILE